MTAILTKQNAIDKALVGGGGGGQSTNNGIYTMKLLLMVKLNSQTQIIQA